MTTAWRLAISFAIGFGLGAVSVTAAHTLEQEPETNQVPAGPPATMGEGGPKVALKGPPGRGRAVFGKISAIQNDALEVTGPDGTKVVVKLTSNTEYRKDRQPAKFTDFKVGDMVMVRTDAEPGGPNLTTASLVASGSPGMMVRGGPGGAGGGMAGTLGKEYVVGEVKSVDPPKLMVLRVDNVTQTLELNEETSLRKGRDSITMAEIQPGDHIFARGAVANDVFVPKVLNVIRPEQWKRLEEMNAEGRQRDAPTQNAQPPGSQPKPPEQRN